MFFRAQNEDDMYKMYFFQSGSGNNEETVLPLEWSIQHGCDNDELLCTVIIQMLCQPDEMSDAVPGTKMQDGRSEATPRFQRPNGHSETESNLEQRRRNDNDNNRGLHESWDWYNECYQRERNLHLFTAERDLDDVRVNNKRYQSALFTRQNNGGDRHGYECPEERDYYPYFTPDPWKDIAILTDNPGSRCSYYRRNSFSGSNTRGTCAGKDGQRLQIHYVYNNRTACERDGHQWFQVVNYLEKAPNFNSESMCVRNSNAKATYLWAVPYDAKNFQTPECLVQVPPPDCQESPKTRSNHHGNEATTSDFPRYLWTLPHFPSETAQRCVLRMRYNISSYDYDPMNTDWTSNEPDPREIKDKYRDMLNEQDDAIWQRRDINGNEKRRLYEELKANLLQQAQDEIENNRSPVRKNPKIVIHSGFPAVQFATNADQMGRVFQDRSHIFRIVPRPDGTRNRRIHNLNVKGKRGNIVQAYPAVEYSFIPNNLRINTNDLVHIQWTGSNTHIGDGQGKQGTDRSNMVQVENYGLNYPISNASLSMWTGAQVVWTPFQGNIISMRTSRSGMFGAAEAELQETEYHRMDSEMAWFVRNDENDFDHSVLNDLEGTGGEEIPVPAPAPAQVPAAGPGANDFSDQPPNPPGNFNYNSGYSNGFRRPSRPSRRGKRAADDQKFLTRSIGPGGFTDENLALAVLTSGKYWCLNGGSCPSYIPQSYVAPQTLSKNELNPTLDQAPASFPGVLVSFSRGTHIYISSRNNQFSNRMQKGKIIVA